MKKLFLLPLFLVGLGLLGYGTYLTRQTIPIQNSIEDQTSRMTQQLWKLEKLYNLTDYAITVQVIRKNEQDFHACADTWGCTHLTEHGDQILISDIRDFPPAWPWEDRTPMQDTILQHEVLHIVFTSLEMPAAVQDQFIHGLQPLMLKP